MSNLTTRIRFFCNYSELPHEISEELQKHAKECETICFYCAPIYPTPFDNK